MAGRATRTLVVWCPDWPLTAAGIAPDQFGAVIRANRVIAATAAARHEGVRRNLRRREAQGRCPELIVVEHDPFGADARMFEPVVAAVEAFTSGIEVLRPGQCALATRGPSRYFGGDEALAALVAEAVDTATASVLEGTAPRCRTGVADGVFAAALAARRGPVTVVEPGASAAFLAPFPAGELDRPELADLLRRLGIRTLGQFAALEPRDVVGRFGADGLAAHRLARGLDERPVSGRVPPPDLVASCELDPPAEVADRVAFAAKVLADDLHRRLAADGLACTRIRVEAETEHGEALARVWRHHGPLTPTAMAERVRWQLDGWLSGTARTRPTAGIVVLRLVPEEVGPDDGRQQGFWGSEAAADERAARALARVQGMLGPEGVVTAVPAGGRDPVQRARFVPWGDPRDPDPGHGRPWPGHLPGPAPSLVPPEPWPAQVTDARGAPVRVSGRGAVSGAPAVVTIAGGAPQNVVAWAGPWPVDERWWDRTAHRRRARFQVTTGDGRAWLLALAGGAWTADARYD